MNNKSYIEDSVFVWPSAEMGEPSITFWLEPAGGATRLRCSTLKGRRPLRYDFFAALTTYIGKLRADLSVDISNIFYQFPAAWSFPWTANGKLRSAFNACGFTSSGRRYFIELAKTEKTGSDIVILD